MNKNFSFYILNLVNHLISELIGFEIGSTIVMNWLVNNFNLRSQNLGLETLTVGYLGVGGGLIGLIIGVLTSLIISHRLGRRLGKNLSFGSHPVLKLTTLSLLTSFILLLVLLAFIPKEY